MSRILAGSAVIGGIALIAAVDFLSGVELRVFPLYYAPISLAAWHFGRSGAVLTALASAAGWFGANQLGGLQFSHPGIWVANTLVQGASFAVVGLLVAGLRTALAREQTLSRKDPLCGLLNSRAFYQEGGRLLELCRRTSRPITLAYLDLDNFKAINDRRGHEAGDGLLRAFADQMRNSVRSSDIPARLGGDEFALLLPELDADAARLALSRLHVALTQSLSAGHDGATLSIGAATFVAIPADVEAMVRSADSIMYAAKRSGKNQVRLDVVGASPCRG